MIMINDLLVDWNDRWEYVDDSSVSGTLSRNQSSNFQTIFRWYYALTYTYLDCLLAVKMRGHKMAEI